MEPPPYNHLRFIDDAQKQLVEIMLAALAEPRLEWAQVAPIMEAARALCRDDLRHASTLAVHGTEYQDGELVPAEEAYLAVSVRDRQDHVEWFEQTYWLSDIALADQDLDRVRSAVTAIERSLDKVKNWLKKEEEQEAARRARAAEAAKAKAASGSKLEAEPEPEPDDRST